MLKLMQNQGARDWIIQRMSALIMAIYFIVFMVYFCCQDHLSYEKWHALFASLPIKVGTVFFMMALVFHAWIGIWTVITDYVKLFYVRAILHTVVMFTLFTCLISTVFLLWSM